MGPMAVQAGVGGSGGGPASRLQPPPGRMYRPRLQAKNAMSHAALLQNGKTADGALPAGADGGPPGTRSGQRVGRRRLRLGRSARGGLGLVTERCL